MGFQIHKRLILTLIAATFASVVMSAQSKSEQTDSLVRLMKAAYIEQFEIGSHQYRKAIDATFLHNGTYFISDTAVWNLQDKIINAKGNVKVIQDETILTSEKMDYYIDDNLAQFRGTLVQLSNKTNNNLRTRYLDYNTKDSTAVFHNGASMRDKDGQVIESIDGGYNSTTKVFDFEDQVNMFTDSIFVKTQKLSYDSEFEKAFFYKPIDFWKGGNMLSANEGFYDRGQELFFFKSKVHGTTKDQEVWGDSLYYWRNTGNIKMFGKVQLTDTTRSVNALSNYLFYEDSVSTVILQDQAAAAMRTEQNGKVDTIYIGADLLKYKSIMRFKIPEAETKAAETRIADMHVDPVSEYRRKAAKEKAEADASEAEKNGGQGPGGRKLGQKLGNKKNDADTLLRQPSDSLLTQKSDSLDLSSLYSQEQLDSIKTAQDKLKAVQDSIAVADSLARIPKDSTKIGFMEAIRNVRVYRKDMQIRCDSLRYSELDSIARFYIDPIVWNDGNRQYSSDSLFVLVKEGGIDRASLLNNAFVITQEDSLCFDQIKGTEIMAYFDTTSALRRFDALGGANAIFFLEENGILATVNKVECKMLSATLIDGEVDVVYYFESPKNNAYPVVQLPKDEMHMKGFNWQPERRPTGRKDITTLRVRPSQRSEYSRHPKASFKQTAIYFPGYMAKVYRELDEREKRSSLPAPEEKVLLGRDSLDFAADSLALRDSTVLGDSPAAADSLATGLALDQAVADSLKIASKGEVDPLATPTVDPKQARKEKREQARALRIARRDARWAELDARDAKKAEEKKQKALDRKRAATLRRVKNKLRLEAKDEAKLQYYIEKYKKQQEKDERRKESDTSRKRSSRTEAGGSLPTVARERIQAPGSDTVLSDPGSVDDNTLLRGSSISGTESRPGI